MHTIRSKMELHIPLYADNEAFYEAGHISIFCPFEYAKAV